MSLAELFGISVDPQIFEGNFSQLLYLGTFYHQHWNEAYSGLSGKLELEGNDGFIIRTHRGLFRSTFTDDMSGFEGAREAIGFCGVDREPFLVNSRLGKFASCLSGNVINSAELADRFMNFGHILVRDGDDVELLAQLIAQGYGFVDGIKKFIKEIKGAHSFLVITAEGIYAVRSPTGHWPMVIGERKGAVAVASESACFGNTGFKLLRDLEPGEIILLKNGKWSTQGKIDSESINICPFSFSYTYFPPSFAEGISVQSVRENLGAILAKRDIEDGFIPDFVCAVPESGTIFGDGYLNEYIRQRNQNRINRAPLLGRLFFKYPHVGRSFTPLSQILRDFEAFIKILMTSKNYGRAVIVIGDDSIVRGTQILALIQKIKDLAILARLEIEIHIRISFPELLSTCDLGKTFREGELFAVRIPSIEDRAQHLGAASLRYTVREDLAAATGLPLDKICLKCTYPHKH